MQAVIQFIQGKESVSYKPKNKNFSPRKIVEIFKIIDEFGKGANFHF